MNHNRWLAKAVALMGGVSLAALGGGCSPMQFRQAPGYSYPGYSYQPLPYAMNAPSSYAAPGAYSMDAPSYTPPRAYTYRAPPPPSAPSWQQDQETVQATPPKTEPVPPKTAPVDNSPSSSWFSSWFSSWRSSPPSGGDCVGWYRICHFL
jgi:hypothetical protein